MKSNVNVGVGCDVFFFFLQCRGRGFIHESSITVEEGYCPPIRGQRRVKSHHSLHIQTDVASVKDQIGRHSSGHTKRSGFNVLNRIRTRDLSDARHQDLNKEIGASRAEKQPQGLPSKLQHNSTESQRRQMCTAESKYISKTI